MRQPDYEWVPTPRMTAAESADLDGFPVVMQKVLRNRNVRTNAEADIFLNRSGSLYDPLDKDRGLLNMRECVRMLLEAIQAGEKIVVYGDYDVDGVTASVIMIQLLRKLGADVESFIPDRFDDGYGLNMHRVRELAEKGCNLLVTVDCGIRSVAETQLAHELGMKIIITDHHEPGTVIPDADAVVCAKQPGDPYPFKELAGCSIAYKVAEAILAVHPVKGVEPKDWIDLVAMGTVADVVPLLDENRCLVIEGLRKMRTHPRPALQALVEKDRLKYSTMKAQTISFNIAPRLNAAGRMDNASTSFRFLMAENLREAQRVLLEVDDWNAKRRAASANVFTVVAKGIDKENLPWTICYRDENFGAGIVGLGAGKLTEKYCRPAVIGCPDGENTRASSRSIDQFNMINALDQLGKEHPGMFVHFGGHAKAAGLTVAAGRWEEFCESIEALAAAELAGQDLKPRKTYDMELPARYITLDLARELEKADPFGERNQEPLFVTRDFEIKTVKVVGKDNNTLKVWLKGKDDREYECISFRNGEWAQDLHPGMRIDLLYHVTVNEFNGETTVQLRVEDFWIKEQS